jgi:hypothetical protein
MGDPLIYVQTLSKEMLSFKIAYRASVLLPRSGGGVDERNLGFYAKSADAEGAVATWQHMHPVGVFAALLVSFDGEHWMPVELGYPVVVESSVAVTESR